MNKINITLPDNSVHEYNIGTSALDIAKNIGDRLAMSTVAASVNDVLVDAFTPINEDANLVIHTADSKIGHQVLLHSTAHVMAQAVKKFWPDCQMTIGPAIENRFYYDFDISINFTEDDLIKIEKKMKELSDQDYKCIRCEMSRSEAYKMFSEMGEDYKLEILENINNDELITSYSQGDFIDLCRGPHIPSTGKIKHFKLLSTSGAYWRGDEKNKMLQRIYGTVFSSKKKLKEYLNLLEEAKKRDHRKLGRELKLFTFDDEVGPGLPLWLPNGAVMVEELEKLAKEYENKSGYELVRTPHLTKGTLYEKSGHLEHYKDSMSVSYTHLTLPTR